MSVRVIEEIISATTGNILCAGTCGIVKEHIKEGTKFDDKDDDDDDDSDVGAVESN